MPASPRLRRPHLPLGIAVVLLLVGAAVAQGIGGTLGLSFTPVRVPVESVTPRPAEPMAAAPPVAAIAVPEGARLGLAAESVADALVARGLARPRIAPDATGPGTLRVVLGAAVGTSAEAFRIDGAGADLTVAAGDVAGAVAGLYAVADRIRSGAEIQRGVITPKLGLRLTDAGSVGREPDRTAFAAGTDYSLNTDVVGSALLPAAPWVDQAAVDRIAEQFRQFVDHSLAQGYNGVVVPGFLEYVTFAGVGDGHAVYPAGDTHLATAQAMVAAFGPVFRYAHDMGMKVFLMTDMLALSPPLERYLDRVAGGLDTSNDQLWAVYRAGLAELFDRMPFLAGLMVRIGEGGDVYQQHGWDYSSRIAVTTPEAVRAMLTALLGAAGPAGKDVIFRTWTVGVGAVGDLHTNPASYETVLGGFNDPHLVVSTKYSLGDFYSHLPLNETLTVGDQRRIVEFQSRREFEGFGAFPNDLTDLHRQALQYALSANPHIEGVWTWTQDGGPLRAGPMSLYLRTGFWQLYDLNTYAAARLAWQPDADPAAITADWIRQTLSTDPATVAAVGEAMALSREAITKGLYLSRYADNTVKALGLQPPPMMWIFEWDIVTGDSAALDSIYQVTRDHIDEVIAEGEQAAVLAGRIAYLVEATPEASWRDPELRRRFEAAADYQADLFQTLSDYRTMFLRHAQWLDTGSDDAFRAWHEAEERYGKTRDAHVHRYGGDVDLPAYNFTAADIGMHRADRDELMSWLARGLLGLVLIGLLLGSALGRRLLGPGLPGSAALRGLWLGATRPWRVADLDVTPTRTDRVLVLALPVAALVASRSVFTWFTAPAHLVLVLGAWLLFGVVLRLLVRGRDPFHLWAAVGGAALLRTVVLLVALSGRGPGRYWFQFWTAPTSRAVYITIAFAAFCWVFVAAGLVLRDGYGWQARRAIGAVLVGLGVPLAVLGSVIAAIGLEAALTIWNDQMALLPWGLSRILGITVYLGIPTGLPGDAAIAGGVLTVAGGLLCSFARRAGGTAGLESR
ncbi:hypothetical protein F4553_007964 [Allocatelliglobosispora scoriae]|uniref:Glycosyl hydrolase family 67 C-terminal domain-containing protein n=1 Tax=Allocatelliglobosispora scoriae TaxID=643052 RepID=A0A841C6H2_9ACTN|nr:hypothetical protein [Allocatelliglobosispora scoriae]MBB5874530.1 hypothetical protein [Allocatelliglobosispora scoriae]